MKRTANAVWNGPGKTGTGKLTTQSGYLRDTQYTYVSRFEQGEGTNPEELIAAAHAGCFTMKLSFVLGAAGFEPAELATECTVTLESGSITGSHLVVTGKVEGITPEKFKEVVDEAKATCPVSKALGIPITVEGSLK